MNKLTELRRFAEKNVWLLTALLIGLILLLAGGGKRSEKQLNAVTAEEQRLSGALTRMEGVGEVYVLLAENPGREKGYAGAVVVCSGGNDPAVRLRITQAVQAFTSLGSDRIIVQKMIS
jgi:hypothetical protein